MRKKIVAGNWKMNLRFDEAKTLFDELQGINKKNVEVILFPSSLYLSFFSKNNHSSIKIGAQNSYPTDNGAFTGEISCMQLKSLGISHVLIGHSERRMLFFESNEFLKLKVDEALKHGIAPIFCCGEPVDVREKNEEIAFVSQQIEASLFHLSAAEIQKCIIAYEPIWAIGTGLTATPEQAETMHSTIRALFKNQYNQDIAESITILYGGSCNEKNAHELFSKPNVDGGLVGGASLKSDSFIKIINAR